MNSEEKKPNPTRPANNPIYPHLKVREKLFANAGELQAKVDAYFEELRSHTKQVMSASGVVKHLASPLTPTIEDFTSYLGFKSKSSLTNYTEAEGYEEFHDIIETARAKILGMKTRSLVNGIGSTQGLIFDLVNNHGYKNKSEVESDNKNETTIRVVYD